MPSHHAFASASSTPPLRQYRSTTGATRPPVRPRRGRQGIHPWLLCALGMLLAGSSLSAVAQAATNRSGPISTFTGVDEIVEACTTATSYHTIPNMTRTFTLGGTANVPVAVLFQGAFSLTSTGFDTGFVRLQIDGVTQGPGEIPVKNDGDLTATHGFHWQSRTLAPGTHTARVQWRTDLGGSFCVDARSLLILHK